MEVVSAKTDIIFKMLFTQHEDLLKDLIATLLDIPIGDIQEIEYRNTELVPEEYDNKSSRLDLALKVNDSLINIEIQVLRDRYFEARTLYYWAELYASELKTGEVYGKLKKTIAINILNFNYFDNPEAHNEIIAINKQTGKPFTDKFSIHFFELSKVKAAKTEFEQDRTALWMQFIKAGSEEEFEMLRQSSDTVINKEVDVIYTMSNDAKIREAARMREKRLHDEASLLYGAREEGREEGLKEGLEKGMEETTANFLKEMKAAGLDEGLISQIINNIQK